jgi:hypothetical protein
MSGFGLLRASNSTIKETTPMSKQPEPKKTIYRDSKDGQFAKQEYSEKHPDKTEKVRVRITPPYK